MSKNRISVVIPTYRREKVLVETIEQLLRIEPPPLEILVIDQTPAHDVATAAALQRYHRLGSIRWTRLSEPSIPHAMNIGLLQAQGEIVLFLDDDINPDRMLIAGHVAAHEVGHTIVAGQVLQPGEKSGDEKPTIGDFSFSSRDPQFINEVMGGNFSVNRQLAIEIGGFDENFVHVAYRFEAEFARRALVAGNRIFFEPTASIRHLKVNEGGTRSFGHHLTTIRPSHAVGAYYFMLRSNEVWKQMRDIIYRPFRAIRTKHHATHPWWIPATLVSEILGFMWAVGLCIRGPRLIRQS